MYIKTKKGFTLIELILYLGISLVIITILSEILISSYISFNKNMNKNSNINSVENAIISIKDMSMSPKIIFKDKEKESVLLYEKYRDYYWVQKIYREEKKLVVEYSERYNNENYKIIKKETIVKKITDFKVFKKKNLIYLKIVMEGEEYIVCI